MGGPDMIRKGDMVIAIADHSQGKYMEGDIFQVAQVRANPCTCGGNHLDIGIRSPQPVNYYLYCHVCGYELPRKGNIHWVHERNFRPAMTFKEETYMVNQIVDVLILA